MTSVAPPVAVLSTPESGRRYGVGVSGQDVAFLVLPVFTIAYLVAADAPLRDRVQRLLGGAGALLVSASLYLLLVELWPAPSRRYIVG